MPATALRYFNEDIARARAIVTHADPLPTGTPVEQLLRSDLLRSAWMFAVGAMDAYYCDAYTDVVAAAIIAKSRQAAITLPVFLYEIKFPIGAILEPYPNNQNWRWRMAARNMMKRENVLNLKTIQNLFNKFFRTNHRFFHGLLASWIIHPDATKRVFGITRAAYLALPPADQNRAVGDALDQMQERYGIIFQRRHDCIHNCDRPKTSPLALKLSGTVLNVIQDVEFLVRRSNEHINTEYREFLVGIGCNTTTIVQAGY